MSENRPAPLFRQRLELVLVAQREDVLSRVRDKISQHYFTFRHATTLDQLKGRSSELQKAVLIVVVQEDGEQVGPLLERIGGVLKRFPHSTVISVLQDSTTKEKFAEAQYARVIPFSGYDFFNTFKFEYICLLKCRSKFFDILPSDLFSMTTLGFTIFVRLRLNQRFLGVAYSGSVLADSKYQKILKAESIYIDGKESGAYLEYINSFYDQKGAALKKRARALFLAICEKWIQLSEYLIVDFKTLSDVEIAEVYGQLQAFGQQLTTLIDSGEDLWETFKDALDNDLFLRWRSPWVAVYAVYISKKSGLGDPVVAFMAAILCDVGLFDISDQIVAKYLEVGGDKLEDQEMAEYKKHPLLSLNRCLIKRLPLSEQVKAVLVSVHEREDVHGFPSQTPPASLPPESSIIRFAEQIDLGTRTTMKETGVGFRFFKEKLWEAEHTLLGNFNKEFLEKISDSLL